MQLAGDGLTDNLNYLHTLRSYKSLLFIISLLIFIHEKRQQQTKRNDTNRKYRQREMQTCIWPS